VIYREIKTDIHGSRVYKVEIMDLLSLIACAAHLHECQKAKYE